ncbi:hypothetical protein G7Y89_g10574 [Cudoniella acicularis]|uniref:Heterokaryon incompatibility domain-containing protein n=1 Tax=Cudoniella acicularis TaxID=354080 RepID=A0A8H4RET6_9HELO|nr:hypothetical protein G7Y89_g10574 [Cudoniella acicularis]
MGDLCGVCFPSEFDLQPTRFFFENAKESCLSCQIIVQTLKFFYPPSGPNLKVLLNPLETKTAILTLSDLQDEEAPSSIVYYTRSEAESRIIGMLNRLFFKILLIALAQEVGGCFETVYIEPETGKCRLYESGGEHENYVTLSHCWGSLTILTTKKNNLSLHKKSIELAALPKTFQDAIQVTRSLGIRYLWIDSLCIVQDDLEDWARESSRMASIYRDSYLTLSATSARDGSEGLFKPREVQIGCVKLTAPGSEEVIATLLARRGRKHTCFQGTHTDIWKNDGLEPLMTRAWVYQERLLSRRLLHFASDEMIWECQTMADCECGFLPTDEPVRKALRDKGDTDEANMSDRSVFEILNSREKEGTEAETQRWYQLIRNYTFLNITKDEDRLPAFSGIASSLITADNYIAGLRKDNGVRDLLWFVLSSTNPRRAKSYIAPSWSWASIIGGIGNYTIMYDYPTEWNRPGNRSLVEILESNTVKSTSDAFGRLCGGELKVRGHCIQGKIFEKDRKDWIGTSWGNHRLRLDIPSQGGMAWLPELIIDTIEDIRHAPGTSVSLLAVWVTEKRIYFLVLVQKTRFSRKLRRVGSATVAVGDLITGSFSDDMVENLLGTSPPKEFIII